MTLTKQDCHNAVALINRAQTKGSEAEEVAQLKQKLIQHGNKVGQPERKLPDDFDVVPRRPEYVHD